MKILCASLWDNTWINYWTNYIQSRGHEVRWLVGSKCSWAMAKNKVEWCDVVLCHWAVGWVNCFSTVGIGKPLFVIHRSFEVFEDTKYYGKLSDNDWSKVTKLFMLNEKHFTLFNEKVKNVHPIFIKNGIDLDKWPLIERDKESSHNVGWIANINHKKGEMLAIHSIAELQSIDDLVKLQHLGAIQSNRIYMYLQNIAPYLKTAWVSYGHVNKKSYVRAFLANQKYILCSSLVEGHPMNILEAMATGCKPLIHRYPGVEHQFPENYIWNNFKDLKRLYQEESTPEKYREFVLINYDYRRTYKPVIDAIEEYV